MKTIVLAEKPSVARDFAQILNVNNKKNGYFENNEYIITWSIGHLVTLYEPGDYDRKFAEWDIKTLPVIPEKIKLKVIKKTSQQFRIIRNLFKRDDVKELIIATDAGREGELVARWLMILGGWRKKPFKRLWISSQTAQAVKKGFASLESGNKYNNLYNAAAARAEADWIIGLNTTRALTCKYSTQLTAGRVQTPTLSLIIKREDEIKNFSPKPYFHIYGDFGDFKGVIKKKDGTQRFNSAEECDKIINAVNGQKGIILKVNTENKKEAPPLLHDLTSLQRSANKIFRFSAKKTLSVLQNLYERHKLVTYPRTDSRYLTSDIAPTLRSRLASVSDTFATREIKALLESEDINTGKHIVDNKKVSDHHALIPTGEKPVLNRLDKDEKKIYELIVKRFVCALSSPYQYKQTNIFTLVAGYTFVTKSIKITEKGWHSVESPVKESTGAENINIDTGTTPENIRKGEQRKMLSASIIKKMTTPPSRYSEASLLAVMENPAKFIKKQDLKQSISGTGLGTPATRAEIIEKLISNDYIERQGTSLVPLMKGRQLIDLVPDELRHPELTAAWEQQLNSISEGRESKDAFIRRITETTKTIVNNIKASEKAFTHHNLTQQKCPMCSQFMLLTNSKEGKILKCSDFKCGYQENSDAKNSGFSKSTRKEKSMGKRLVNKYSDHKKKSNTPTLGSLLDKVLK